MCRVLAYIGPETPLAGLLLEPDNSLVNQSLDPEGHPQLQLAGWGFGAWGEHLLEPDRPLIYRRPMPAFFDDNATGIIPSLQVSTMLAHVRAADYNARTVLTDENCHPFSFTGTPWIVAQNGDLPHWNLLQRRLLAHCDDDYLSQMRGSTDTEFLYVLLLSLLEGDSDDEVQRAFERMLGLIVDAMRELDLVGLTKLKMALVSPHRIIGVNAGTGHDGETHPDGDWQELRKAEPGSDDHLLSMLLEPMYLLVGRRPEDREVAWGIEASGVEDATSVIFASEPLTEDTDGWTDLDFDQIVFLERRGGAITKRVAQLDV